VLAFAGLFEWDVPLTRFVRSFYPEVGSESNPWLVQFSDIGDRLGKGESLVILSLVLLAVGYGLKHPLESMPPSPKKNNSPDSARSARRSSAWCERSIVVIAFGSCGDRRCMEARRGVSGTR
jgi:hypothetical protein